MFWQGIWETIRRQLFTPEKLVAIGGKLIQIVLIVGMAVLFAWILGKVLKRMLGSRSRIARKQSAKTVFTMLRSMVYYVFFFIALIMVLRVIGVDFSAILAGAGVVGLAIGFGAQTLVRDFLSGFFLLFEDSVNVGDFITIGDIAGTVEFIGVRRTQVRAFDGTLYTIPNGELTKFGNKNRDFMRAVVTVDLAYEQDAEQGMEVAHRVVDGWCAEHRSDAVGEPEVQGLLSFGESGVTIRVVVMVKPMRHWEAERQLRVELKKAFDAAGVEIPFPRRVVYTRQEAGGAREPESPAVPGRGTASGRRRPDASGSADG